MPEDSIISRAPEFRTASESQTRALGSRIGRLLVRGDVVALDGPLGAGKTTLVKGIAEGLGVDPAAVSSPTFALIHEYEGKCPVFHVDWYRLEAVRGTDRMLSLECFDSPGVTLVEWAERGKALLPAHALRIELAHAGGDVRTIRLKGAARAAGIAKALA